MEKEPEIRIQPEETDNLVKMLKLRMEGYNYYQIAKKMGIAYNSVKRDLDRIERDYSRIRKFLTRIQGVGYFANKQRVRLSTPEVREHADAAILKLLSQGVPLAVGNAIGGRAHGYRQVGNRVEVDSSSVQLARDIFQTYHDGGNMSELFRKHKLPQTARRNITRMIRNPLYIGKIIYKGHEFVFQQLAIIDESLWKECQPRDRASEKPTRRFCGVKPLYGFVRRAGRWEKATDSKVIQKIIDVIDLKIARKSYAAIAAMKDLKWSQVHAIINDPIYAGKVIVDGKPVDAGVEGFVSYSKWLEAHNISPKMKSYEASRETRRQLEADKMQNVFDYIKDNDDRGTRWSDLVQQEWPRAPGKNKVKYSKTALDKYLHNLKVNGKIEKRDGRWFIAKAPTAPGGPS